MSRITGDPSLLDVEALTSPSRANNRVAEITGVLMRRGGYFAHVMEGPRTAVEDTFLRIIADKRHHSLRVLSRKAVSWREFGIYEMNDVIPDDKQIQLIEYINYQLPTSSADARLCLRKLQDAA